MSTPTTKKMVTLRSNDGEQFEIEEAVAMMSRTLQGMIEDDCADSVIPVNNIAGNVLAKVIEYCRKHVADADTDEDLENWDAEFIKVEIPVVFDLLLAANYLDIRGLLDLGSQTIADFIKDKSVEEVRYIFNVVNDFTKEEEDAVRAENAWAFE